MPAQKKKPSKTGGKPKKSAEKDNSQKAAVTSAKKTAKSKARASKEEAFPIVGTGASAGGLEALESFFECFPTDSDINKDRRLKAVHKALREVADRITGGEESELSGEEQVEFMRLIHELEQSRYALELAEIELAAKSEKLLQISRELEKSRSDLWSVSEFIPAAFVVLDKKGIVKRANAAARKMLVGNFKPLTGVAFSSFIMPEDMGDYRRHIKARLYNPDNRDKIVSFELRMKDYLGRMFHTYGQILPRYDIEGRLLRWHLAFFDISEQKRLEEALRVSREHLAMATGAGKIGIWVGDLKTGKSFWNDQLYLLLGLKPREGPEDGEAFFEYIHPDDRKEFLEGTQALVKHGNEIDTEFRIIRANDGRTRWLAAKGVIDREEDGRPLRIRGVNFDITDRKQAEEMQLAMRLQMGEQLAITRRINEELSQYAYAVSHDLKAPLRAIHNYCDFLYEDLAKSLSGEQKKYLVGLGKAADQGQTLIDDLLAYSRIGRTSTEAERIDMAALISEAKSFLNLPSDIDLTMEKDWPLFEADPLLLSQILKNLIANAIKFNHSNSKKVDIGWRQAVENGSIELFVRDNGVGIDPQYRQQIFGIFQRLHTSSEYEGTGIGLAIVQKAAKEMGGAVRVESVPGEGSTFYVRIPRKAVDRRGDGSPY